MTGSSDEPQKMSRRQRRQLDRMGNAIDQPTSAYDLAKAQDPRIEEALQAIDGAPDTRVFAVALSVAAAMEGIHGIGSYRLDWVMAGRRNLVRLTGEHYDESEEQAEVRVKEAESLMREKLGQTPIVWMVAIGSTRRDDVTSMFVHMIDALGLPDPREPAVAPEEVATDEGPSAGAFEYFDVAHLERLALLYQDGLITEDEYQLLKAKIINS